VLSGWARNVERPDMIMVGMCMLAFLSVAALGAAGHVYFAMAALVVYGYATTIASLLQYTMIQAHTPDSYLGRVNSLWAALDNFGDIAGALLIGAAAQILLPAQTVLFLGIAAMMLGLLLRATRRAGLAADAERGSELLISGDTNA